MSNLFRFDSRSLFLAAAVTVLSLSAGYFTLAWTEPSGTMPVTVDAPINTGSTAQTKTGDLSIGSNAIKYWITQSGQSFALKNNNGTTTFIIGQDGNIGIGTASPNNTIQVKGLVSFPNSVFGTFLGYQAGNVNTGNRNTFVGYQSGLLNTTGYQNTATGYGSLGANTTGGGNTANGHLSLSANTDGYSNSALGDGSLEWNTGGYFNTAIGYTSLSNNTTGNYNTASGGQSLGQNTTGSNNTAYGFDAGDAIFTGSSNTFLGSGAGSVTSLQKGNAVNSMALGYGTYTTADNQVVIGNLNITQTLLRGNVGIGTTSPTDLLSLSNGSNSINLRQGNYTYLGSDYSAWTTILGQNVRARRGATANMELGSGYLGSGASAIRLNWNNIEFHAASASDISSLSEGSPFNFPKMIIQSDGKVVVNEGGQFCIGSTCVSSSTWATMVSGGGGGGGGGGACISSSGSCPDGYYLKSMSVSPSAPPTCNTNCNTYCNCSYGCYCGTYCNTYCSNGSLASYATCCPL